jgi:carboxyl-terminal processing protease
MANNLFRSIGLVSAVALIPTVATAIAAIDVNSYKDLNEFMNAFERVRTEYVEQVDDKTLVQGAIRGMLASLDPHSSYLDERGYKAMMTSTDGEYGGLGLNIVMEDGIVKVIAATEDTPADRAGIKAGDYITHLDDKLLYGGTLDEAAEQMRGKPGTSIRVTIVRPGRDKPFDIKVTREIIKIVAVKWEIKDQVGIINVNTFNRTVVDEVLAAISSIEKSLGRPPLGYIMDLRSNPGGLFDQAIGLSDLFLEQGEIVSQRGRSKSDIERFYAQPGDAANALPIIVLVDSGTASAAEIVAGALQDHHRAIVMGERTFGKGLVQTLLPLSQQTALLLTTDRYYTPSGRSVQEGGIAPDIAVPQLSDPDYRAPRFRETDLRRHLVNEIKVDDSIIQDDNKPDPRFTATVEELAKKNIKDFQLYYALQTLVRLGKMQTATSSGHSR